jgi:hypothetical protein
MRAKTRDLPQTMYPSRFLNSQVVRRGLRAAAYFGVAFACCCATAWAQTPTPPPLPPGVQANTTVQLVSLGQTLTDLSAIAAGRNVGNSLRLLTAVEVAGTPMGSSAGGFAFKLDKTTGLQARRATTFGPSFAERAITAGAGNMSVSVNLAVATYDKLDETPLHEIPLFRAEGSPIPQLERRGTLSLVLTSTTTVIQTVMGATEDLDVGVSIPMVKLKLDGLSFVEDNAGNVLVRATGQGESSGLGDIGLMAKYRFLRFGGTPPPDAPVEADPGGVALIGTARLPTGSKDNLRGLGITRVLGGLVVSFGRGRLRPHANVGYEWWSKGIDVVSDVAPTVTARHHFQYSAGLEVEAAPRLTLNLDFLSRKINGAGKVGTVTQTVNFPGPPGQPGIAFSQLQTYPVTLPEGTLEQSLIPGVKWNVRGKVLLVLNGIINLRDNGIYDKFTPVVGLDITF